MRGRADDVDNSSLGAAETHPLTLQQQHAGRSDRHNAQHLVSQGAPPAAVGRGCAPTGALSLDRCTHDAPAHEEGGEWYVQQTTVDDYSEFVIVEDADHTLGRRPKGKKPREDLADDVDAKVEESNAATDGEKSAAAARRAKRNLKWKVRCLRADRIVTLTARGGIPTWMDAWRLWGQFERGCWRRYRGNFEYVVVLERHQSGTYHIHFAVNRFMDANTLRLQWHRALTGDARLAGVIRGEESPGNVDISMARKSQKIAGYLGKYLGKGFDSYGRQSKRSPVKRFASSKGVGEPERRRSRLAATCGEHVYRLRRLAESRGWRCVAFYEGTVAGRVLAWVGCVKERAAARPQAVPAATLAGALASGYS